MIILLYIEGYLVPTNVPTIYAVYFEIGYCANLPNIRQSVSTILQVSTMILLQIADGSLFRLHFAGR